MIVILEKFVNCKPIKLSEYPYQVWRVCFNVGVFINISYPSFIRNLISLLFQLLKKRRIVSLVSERRFFFNFLIALGMGVTWVWAWYYGFVLLVTGLRKCRLCEHGLHGGGWLKFDIWVWPVCLLVSYVGFISFFVFGFLVKVTKIQKNQLSFSGKMLIFYTENKQTGQLIF